MKSRISNQAPALSTYLELNQKHGYGYQARMVMDGIIDSVIDTEPFTLDEAYSGATFAIEEINKETGYNYDPHKVIRITGGATDGNKSRDFTTARVARDIERGRGGLSYPAGHDYTIKAIDGKEEQLLSGMKKCPKPAKLCGGTASTLPCMVTAAVCLICWPSLTVWTQSGR